MPIFAPGPRHVVRPRFYNPSTGWNRHSPQARGLVFWTPFQALGGLSGDLIDVIGGLRLTRVGATNKTDPTLGRVEDFNSDHFTVSSTLVTAAPFSLAMWVLDNKATRSAFISIADTGASNQFWYLRIENNNTLSMSATSTTPGSATTGNASTNGEWSHIAGREVASNDRQSFLNGDVANKGTNSSTRTPTGVDTITIGRLLHGTGPTLTDNALGLVGDCRIYDYALSDHEFENLYWNPWDLYPPEQIVIEAPSGGTSVSQTAVSLVESRQGIAASSVTLVESRQAISRSAVILVESRQEVSASAVSLVESRQEIKATAITLIESEQLLEPTAVTLVESLQEIQATGITLIESLQEIQATAITLIESRQGIEQAGITLVESTSSSTPVSNTAVTLIESLQEIKATVASLVESQQALAGSAVTLVESVQEIQATGVSLIESRQGLSLGLVTLVESQEGISVSAITLVESLLDPLATAVVVDIEVDALFTIDADVDALFTKDAEVDALFA